MIFSKPVLWKPLIKNYQEWEHFCNSAYQQHKDLNLPDVVSMGSLPIPEHLIDITEKESLFFNRNQNKDSPDYDPVIAQSQRTLSGNQPNEKITTAFYSEDTALTQYVMQQLNLRVATVNINEQWPGNTISHHIDLGRSFMFKSKINTDTITNWDVKNFAIFLSDSSPGQVFMWGDTAVCKWKKHDVFFWPWYMPHATANASFTKRRVAIVNGA